MWNKFLANAGVCSRREADEFITAGVVSVNGEVVTELGTKIKRGDEVKFHDQTVSIERKIYVLLNKPKDTVTTSDDPQARRTVMDLVKGACNERIYPVGRQADASQVSEEEDISCAFGQEPDKSRYGADCSRHSTG